LAYFRFIVAKNNLTEFSKNAKRREKLSVGGVCLNVCQAPDELAYGFIDRAE
jgi:hypothetical protein